MVFILRGLVKAVHGVRGEHAAARPAAGAGGLLHGLKLLLGDLPDVLRADRLEYRVEVGVLASGGMLALRSVAYALGFTQRPLRNLTQQCVRLPVYV